MSFFLILIAGIFLPLFPLSMVFNTVLARITHPVARVILILVWPQIGVLLLAAVGLPIVSDFLIWWALFSAVFYAWRLLTVRELGQWAAMLATSVGALTWVLAGSTTTAAMLHLFTLWLSVAPALLVVIGYALTNRFGAAYAGLVTGLARDLPRLSTLIVIIVLAAMALPIFPGFFSLLQLLMHTDFNHALPILLTWLIWSWAGARLLNGLVFGPRCGKIAEDLALGSTWIFGLTISTVILLNLVWAGV